MKTVKSNIPELDEALNNIWEDFSVSDDTSLPEALRLCHARVRELEAVIEQRDIVEEIMHREPEAAEEDNGCCDDPGCIICRVKDAIANKARGN